MKTYLVILFSFILFSCEQKHNQGYEVFEENSFYGLKHNGTIVIGASYQEMQIVESSSNMFIHVTKDNKSGILDSLGNILIPCDFDSVLNITDSSALVVKNNLTGLLSLNGDTILPIAFESIETDSLGVFILKKSGKYGISSISSDTLFDIIPNICDRIEKNGYFYNVLKNGKHGMIDYLGREIVPFNFDEIVEIGRIENEQYFLFRVSLAGKYGVYSNNRGALSEPIYDRIEPFENKISKIKLNNKWGFMGIRGEILLKPSYDELEQFNDEGDAVFINDGNKGIINRNSLFNQGQKPTGSEIEIQ